MSEVCQCEDKDHTVEICIGQYQQAMKEADKWFLMLQKHCEHKVDLFCHIPVGEVPPGVIICMAKKCPLVK